MPLSDVDICNLALGHLQTDKRISSLTSDTSREARACNTYYQNTLESAIGDGEWKFARKRGALIVASGTPPSEWGYQYDWPSDAITLLHIEDGLKTRRPDQRIPFRIEIESATGKRLIFTDQLDAVMIYMFLNTATATYPPAFSRYLSWRLAAEMAMAITHDATIQQAAAVGAQLAALDAMSTNEASEQDPIEPDSPSIASRQ